MGKDKTKEVETPKYDMQVVVDVVGQTLTTAQRMREKINAVRGASYAKCFTAEDELLQVKSWIKLKEFFKLGTGCEGFPGGQITQIIGEPDSGKTTIMMEGMVSCQKAGGVVYLIDSEHKFSMARFVLMGGVAEDLVVIQVESLEAAWDAINDVCKAMTEERIAGNFFQAMLCWDSVAASVPDKILDEDEAGDSHVSVEAKLNNKNVRKLHQAIKRSELACVFINHFYMTMPKGRFDQPKLKIKGGEELEFFSLLIIKTKKGAKIERTIKGETQKLGRVTKFEIVKGHFHGRTIEKEVYVVDKGILESKEELEEYKKTLRGDL